MAGNAWQRAEAIVRQITGTNGNITVRWKPGTVCSVDADLAGKALDGILERHGRLTPELVVDESRPEDAPLHPEFEWDDRIAAENWRRNQASYLIRHIAVEVPNRQEPTLVRAFVSVRRRMTRLSTRLARCPVCQRRQDDGRARRPPAAGARAALRELGPGSAL